MSQICSYELFLWADAALCNLDIDIDLLPMHVDETGVKGFRSKDLEKKEVATSPK